MINQSESVIYAQNAPEERPWRIGHLPPQPDRTARPFQVDLEADEFAFVFCTSLHEDNQGAFDSGSEPPRLWKPLYLFGLGMTAFICFDNYHKAKWTKLEWPEWVTAMVLISWEIHLFMANTCDGVIMVAKLAETEEGTPKRRASYVSFAKGIWLYLVGMGLVMVVLAQETAMDAMKSIAALGLVQNLPKLYFHVRKSMWARRQIAIHLNRMDSGENDEFNMIFATSVSITNVHTWPALKGEYVGPIPAGCYVACMNLISCTILLVGLSRMPILHNYLWWSCWEARNSVHHQS